MRVRIISSIVLLAALVTVGRLGYLQLLYGDEYAEAANRQYVRPQSREFSRGTIYLSEKDGRKVAAATLRDSYYLVLNPSLIEDPMAVYNRLLTVLTLDKDSFLAKASKVKDVYEVIVKDVQQADAEHVSALKIKGVTMYIEKKRHYPGGRLGSGFIGFVAKSKESGDSISGKAGLEAYFDDILTRHSGGIYVNFFAEIFSNLGSAFVDDDNNQLDGDVVTTVEPTVQKQLEEIIKKTETDWHADQLGGIILEPATGRIVAMASYPDFDPGESNKVTDPKVFVNPNIESIFEVGSTMKPLVMAIGIDTGAVTPETTYVDKGTIILDKKKISNYDGKPRGKVNMQEVLNQSLNVGMVFVQQKIGNANFSEYMRKYGFGGKTGIELPGEASGLIGNLSSDRDVNYATAAFGQGIAVTPIQMAAALSSLANGGKLIPPYIVDRIEYRLGVVDKTETGDGIQVIKPESARTITNMLVNVVDKALLNGKVKMERYSIAAKTGTAQMVNSETKEYYEDRYLHSFFGYLPASNPRFLIFLYHTYPKGAQYASATLTDPFMSLSKFLINYYNIAPDR